MGSLRNIQVRFYKHRRHGCYLYIARFNGYDEFRSFKVSENGGIALAQIAQHYLGDYGIIILSLIIIVACLKTAIGLITAFSETFTELFPKMNYLWLATGVAILLVSSLMSG